jgi:hypothetical protein
LVRRTLSAGCSDFLPEPDLPPTDLLQPESGDLRTSQRNPLKKAILHRKNALFYKTMNGARVGDLFMSLIHTCELNKVNPFDYLAELLRHPAEVAVRPAEWMPWNYRRDTTAVAA